MIEKILYFISLYLAQMLICSIFNTFNATRIQTNYLDFFKLTFLPYLIWFIMKNGKEKLKK